MDTITLVFLLGAHKIFLGIFLDFFHLVLTKEQKSFHTFAPLLRAVILCRRALGLEGEDMMKNLLSIMVGICLFKVLFSGRLQNFELLTNIHTFAPQCKLY
jgi:hypothetical protein